jgi:hypothetical protein
LAAEKEKGKITWLDKKAGFWDWEDLGGNAFLECNTNKDNMRFCLIPFLSIENEKIIINRLRSKTN